MFAVLLFITTAGNPWYDLLLVALVALTGMWQLLGVIAGDYVFYLATELGGGSIHLLRLSYGGALLLAVGVSAVTLIRSRQGEPRASSA